MAKRSISVYVCVLLWGFKTGGGVSLDEEFRTIELKKKNKWSVGPTVGIGRMVGADGTVDPTVGIG